MQVNLNKRGIQSFAGKVFVYTDFDGTYCPEKHSAMHNPEQNHKMVDYCKKMDSFLKTAGDDLELHVTTGRTLGEFEAVSWLLKFRDYRLPLPKSVIVKNGSDEFLKTGKDSDFYDNGKFPFSYNHTSQKKEKMIKELTNWNGEKIHKFIKDTAQKYYLRFVEAESENSVKDYGNKSLFSKGKLNPKEWHKLPQKDGEFLVHQQPIVDFELGSRNDGKLKVNLVFPPDFDYCPFRHYIYDSCTNEIKSYLDKKNIKYFQSWDEPNHKNHYRKSTTFTPLIKGKELNKLFDTQNAVSEALRNNDLVIVAGDGSNDFDMLNPLQYIPQEDWEKYAQNSDCPEFYMGDMRKKLRDLRHLYKGYDTEYINDLKKDFEKNGFLKRLEEMPMMGIVIKKENSKLQKLIDTFAKSGKIVEVEKGQIDEGIKRAINNYSKNNPKFKDDLSQSLKNIL